MRACVYTYVCVATRVRASMCVCVCVCVRACVRACVRVRMCIRTSVWLRACVRLCVCVCFACFVFPPLLLDHHSIAKRVHRLKTRKGQQDPTSIYAQKSNDCPDTFCLYDQAKYIDSRAVTSYTTACSFTLRKRQTIFLASLAAVLLWQTSSHILHYCTDAPSQKKKKKRERKKTDNLAGTEELRFEKQPLLQDCNDIPSQGEDRQPG